MEDFYTLLNAFISTHKTITDETKDRKNRILSYVKLLYNNYLDAYKKNFDNKKLTDEDKTKYGYKKFELIDKNKKNQSGLKKKLREKCKNHYGLK